MTADPVTWLRCMVVDDSWPEPRYATVTLAGLLDLLPCAATAAGLQEGLAGPGGLVAGSTWQVWTDWGARQLTVLARWDEDPISVSAQGQFVASERLAAVVRAGLADVAARTGRPLLGGSGGDVSGRPGARLQPVDGGGVVDQGVGDRGDGHECFAQPFDRVEAAGVEPVVEELPDAGEAEPGSVFDGALVTGVRVLASVAGWAVRGCSHVVGSFGSGRRRGVKASAPAGVADGTVPTGSDSEIVAAGPAGLVGACSLRLAATSTTGSAP